MTENILGREVTAQDVAMAFTHLALSQSTVANVATVDGGNIAAALRWCRNSESKEWMS